MHSFIFVSKEGFTFKPSSEAIEPDIENLQVLGIERGGTGNQAFEKLLEENKWLQNSGFEEVFCFELKNEPQFSETYSIKETCANKNKI